MLGCSITPIHPNFYISFFALKYLYLKLTKQKTPVHLQYYSIYLLKQPDLVLLIICLLTTNNKHTIIID